MLLSDFFEENPRLAVSFSGGVDSSYLLYAAKSAGCDVSAYFLKTAFQPQFELRDAEKLAKSIGVPLVVESTDILQNTSVISNQPDRCYHCKKALFTQLLQRVHADGFPILCDGSNADDSESDRPGMRVLTELSVVSPLRICGLSKRDIRRLSKNAGLFTHDKPSYSCLATRIPIGTDITAGLLHLIEQSEAKLFALGFNNFRIRLLPPKNALIQLTQNQFTKAAHMHDVILSDLKRDFDMVLLDLNPRQST